MGLITPSSNQSGGRAVSTMTSSKLLNLIYEVWEVKTIYRQIIYNSTRVQGDSGICGQFCCLYIVQRHYNPHETFSDVLNETFSADLEKNEQKVQEFMKRFS